VDGDYTGPTGAQAGFRRHRTQRRRIWVRSQPQLAGPETEI